MTDPSLNKPPEKSIFAGIDDLIELRFDIWDIGTRQPRYRNAKAGRKLSRERSALGAEMLVEQMLDQIHFNWRSFGTERQPSTENWRFKKQLYIAAENESREKTLEKAISRAAGDAWVNQVPTASGLVSATSDRSRNLDLVCQSAPGRFEFIELKFKSDNPLFAAIEILKAGVLYIFARSLTSKDSESPLLKAKAVHLRVLAPLAYYRGHRLDWLETAFSTGLQNAVNKRSGSQAFTMDFMFGAFPANFEWPCSDEALVSSLAQRAPVSWSID